eukprot:627167-Lingulodinium_polyedra.AAC.1
MVAPSLRTPVAPRRGRPRCASAIAQFASVRRSPPRAKQSRAPTSDWLCVRVKRRTRPSVRTAGTFRFLLKMPFA